MTPRTRATGHFLTATAATRAGFGPSSYARELADKPERVVRPCNQGHAAQKAPARPQNAREAEGLRRFRPPATPPQLPIPLDFARRPASFLAPKDPASWQKPLVQSTGRPQARRRPRALAHRRRCHHDQQAAVRGVLPLRDAPHASRPNRCGIAGAVERYDVDATIRRRRASPVQAGALRPRPSPAAS